MLALGKHKREAEPLARTTICTITLTKLPTIASQWPSLLLHSWSSSLATLNMSQQSSPTSLSTLPCALTPSPPTRLPSLDPSMILRPMLSGTGPSYHALSRMSLQDMRISPPSSCEPLSQALPPPYNRERRSTTVRLTTSGSTSQMSMWNAAPSNSTSKTLTASPYYAPMDLRTTMGGSLPSLSLAQMGRALLSSSNNWMMAEWQDLAPKQEVSMMLTLLTSLPYHPLMINLLNPSLTASMPTSGATTPTSIHFRRPSSPSMTGASSLRFNDTRSWTERLLHYRRSLT